MADYVEILDTQIEPDAPLTAVLAGQWRDNVLAIAEGAPDAPRIKDAALDTEVTDDGRDWVLERTASSASNTVGTYAFLATNDISGTNNLGTTRAGSSLSPVGIAGDTTGNPTRVVTDGSVSGTWRCMGYKPPPTDGGTSGSRREATLWLRIS